MSDKNWSGENSDLSFLAQPFKQGLATSVVLAVEMDAELVGFYELVTTPDQPPNPWSFQCFDQSNQGATCVILKPEDHATVVEYLGRLDNPHLVCIAPLRGENESGFIEMFAGLNEAGQNIGLVLCDPKGTRDGPNLALCLVAFYEPQSRIVVAVIPPDQKNFLSDLKSRRIQQNQQQAQQQQQQQLPAHSTAQMLAHHSMTTDQHQQLPAHSTEQMLAHPSMTTDQHQQMPAHSTEQMLAHPSMLTGQHQQLPAHSTAQMLAHPSMTTDQHQQLPAHSTSQPTSLV